MVTRSDWTLSQQLHSAANTKIARTLIRLVVVVVVVVVVASLHELILADDLTEWLWLGGLQRLARGRVVAASLRFGVSGGGGACCRWPMAKYWTICEDFVWFVSMGRARQYCTHCISAAGSELYKRQHRF